MPVINGVYLKDFTALPSSVTDANIIPIAITGNQIAYRTTVAGIVTDARVTGKLLTGLSVTGGAIAATDTILAAFGKVQNQINGKVSSVGLTMPSAFNVANSPITSSGTLAVTAAGVASQYIRGDGALADFPTNGGGGSSVAYYLNGSVNQGTFVGNTYYEMNKTPVIGAGTDFTIGADGYIAQFITDANDPASLLIPAGNWNVEMYFSASSSGGTPSFYVEVYKYNGTTFTLLGTSSATPEGITNGTAIDIYYTSVGIPETVLTITDRLAIRVYVTHSGRTITLHTEDNHLSEIVTTFSNGLTALNGLTKQAQYFAVGSAGTDFNIASSVDTHTFNIPDASASARGLITTGAQTIGGDKTIIGVTANPTLILKNSSTGRILEVKSTGGNNHLTINNIGQVSIFENFTIGGGSTFDMGQTMLATGSSYFQSTLSVTRLSSANSYTIAFRTGATQVSATPNWYAGNYSGNNDFEITNYAAGALETSLKINSTTNLVTLFGGISATTANFTGQLTLGSTITNGTYTYTLPSATGTLALVGGAGVGTVTSVAALTLGTSGTDLSSTVANGTTTPVITLNVPTASASNRGALSSADWSTFNGKQGTITLTTTGTSGAATFSANTLNIPNYGSALSGYLPLSGGTLTGALSGTSATFSGALDVTNTIRTDGASNSILLRNGYTATIRNPNNNTRDLQIEGDGVTATFKGAGNVLIGTTTDSGYKLDVNGTGRFAAPSGTQENITVKSANTGFSKIVIDALTSASSQLAFLENGTQKGVVGYRPSTGNVFLANATGDILTIASTGAATFSSSVTATGLTVSLSNGAIARFSSAIAALGTTSIGLGYTDGSGGHDMAKIFGQRINDGSGRSSLILAVNAVDNDQSATVSDAKITISGSTGGITLASALTGTSATFSGAVSKGSGSFRIEHPLPLLSETHQLVHSFIEGPQADLIYRGKLTLVNGKAQANIDDIATMTEGTFEVLCRDVQCFTTNESGWDLIKGKVIGNIIYIESQNEKSTDEISWMVIGERKDKHMMETEWTDENGKVIVEPLKPIEPEPMKDLTEVQPKLNNNLE